MDWYPLVYSILPVASALGAVWLTNRYSGTLEGKRRLFEAKERRYDHRREAVLALGVATQDMTMHLDQHWRLAGTAGFDQATWIESRDDLLLRVTKELWPVLLLCPDKVAESARALVLASADLNKAKSIDDELHLAHRGALVQYRQVCRAMLSEDDTSLALVARPSRPTSPTGPAQDPDA